MGSIRPKVVCLLRNANRFLLIRVTDPHEGRKFLIPPGGGVEFGETLEHAARREVLEEVGVRLDCVEQLAMFENMFTYEGRREHELVFVFSAACTDADLCLRSEVEITESNDAKFSAGWYSLEEVRASGLPLFPEGLLIHLQMAGTIELARRKFPASL